MNDIHYVALGFVIYFLSRMLLRGKRGRAPGGSGQVGSDGLMDPQLRARRFRTLQILTLAFFAAVGAFAFSLWNLLHLSTAPPGRSLAEAASAPMTQLYAVISVALGVASFPVKRFLGDPRGAAPESLPAMQRKFTAHLLAIVLADTSAVFGFLTGLTTRNFEVAVPFFCFALLLFILHFPREA